MLLPGSVVVLEEEVDLHAVHAEREFLGVVPATERHIRLEVGVPRRGGAIEFGEERGRSLVREHDEVKVGGVRNQGALSVPA